MNGVLLDTSPAVLPPELKLKASGAAPLVAGAGAGVVLDGCGCPKENTAGLLSGAGVVVAGAVVDGCGGPKENTAGLLSGAGVAVAPKENGVEGLDSLSLSAAGGCPKEKTLLPPNRGFGASIVDDEGALKKFGLEVGSGGGVATPAGGAALEAV